MNITPSKNAEIKRAARIAGVPLWRIAAALNVHEMTLTRWLRFELPEDKKQRILAAIAEIEREEA